MKKKLLTLALLAGGSLFAQTRFSIGVNIGGGYPRGYYAPAPVYAAGPAYYAEQPPYPGPGYSWVDGYWADPGYGYARRTWVAGFWRAPRYEHFERARGYERREFREDRFSRGFRR